MHELSIGDWRELVEFADDDESWSCDGRQQIDVVTALDARAEGLGRTTNRGSLHHLKELAGDAGFGVDGMVANHLGKNFVGVRLHALALKAVGESKAARAFLWRVHRSEGIAEDETKEAAGCECRDLKSDLAPHGEAGHGEALDAQGVGEG